MRQAAHSTLTTCGKGSVHVGDDDCSSEYAGRDHIDVRAALSAGSSLCRHLASSEQPLGKDEV